MLGKEEVKVSCTVLSNPHLSDYLTDLKWEPSPLHELRRQKNYATFNFTVDDETLISSINGGVMVNGKDKKPVGNMMTAWVMKEANKEKERAHLPQVCFSKNEVRAAIVTAGAPCPGTNAAIREIVMTLRNSYNVNAKVYGIKMGFSGMHLRPYVELTTDLVESWHSLGGSQLGLSKEHFNVKQGLAALRAHGVNQLYVIGGAGSHQAASLLYKAVKEAKLKLTISCIPKNVSNDFPVIDRSFGFDSAVEEAQLSLESAYVEASSGVNGIGLVKLMGKQAGFLAMHAALSSRIVDICLIPDISFELGGSHGVLEHVVQVVMKKGFCVVVIADGCNIGGSDCGLELKRLINDHFKSKKIECNLKYIDPTFSIRSIKANPRDQEYCMKLGQHAVHGAMAGYTGLTVGPLGERYVQIPLDFINMQAPRRIFKSTRQWIRLLLSTGQPSFLPTNTVSKEHDDDGQQSNALSSKL